MLLPAGPRGFAMSNATKLPSFIQPMLATPAAPFDSDDHLFEIKWDGIRCLAFIEEGSLRLRNRRRTDQTDRYPEFACLKALPPGTVLDGEIIMLKDGKPSFPLLLSREQARTPLRIQGLSKAMPATFMVFDLLYLGYESWLNKPLRERRTRLTELIKPVCNSYLQLSEGITGKGRAYFAEAVRQDLEGVVAKRLDSRYQPGQRHDAWLKIKRQSEVLCAVIGFTTEAPNDFRSLIIACDQEGELRCVGKVGSGIEDGLRKTINQFLWSHLLRKPLVPCTIKGKWVAPGMFCKVAFQEQMESGDLRSPVFKELIINDDVAGKSEIRNSKSETNPKSE
jgi:bifunctional non-homologous end joining protein LigD